jgi:integrase
VRPAANSLGIVFGGWHDFRHTLLTTLRRSGVHPKVVSDILGHKKVNLAMDVYDRTDVGDLEQPLEAVSSRLLPNVTQTEPAA